MNIKIEITAGPLRIEIEADGEEDYIGVVQELFGLIEEQDIDLDDALQDADGGQAVQPTLAESAEKELGDSADGSNSHLSDLMTRTDVSIEKLEQIIYIDADLEDDPYLLIDPEEAFGTAKAEKQRGVMKVLLLVWDYVYHEEKVSTSRLQDSVTRSNVDATKIRDQYDEDVHTSGAGRGTKIELTRPGELKAVEAIQDMGELVK